MNRRLLDKENKAPGGELRQSVIRFPLFLSASTSGLRGRQNFVSYVCRACAMNVLMSIHYHDLIRFLTPRDPKRDCRREFILFDGDHRDSDYESSRLNVRRANSLQKEMYFNTFPILENVTGYVTPGRFLLSMSMILCLRFALSESFT